jgi:hypothetical protein
MNRNGITAIDNLVEAHNSPGKLLVLKAVDADQTVRQFYLPLDGDFPIILGTGRNAVVFLAASTRLKRPRSSVGSSTSLFTTTVRDLLSMSRSAGDVTMRSS